MAQLSDKTIAIVKSTAPILQERGLDITIRFYSILFNRYPQAKEYFNFANQVADNPSEREVEKSVRRSGSQPQALANAVYAYAANIDNLGALLPAVEKIAQKHASLDVPPEAYPLVGECLIEAVAQILGPELVTPDVGVAWTEAYNFLAKIFIDRENQIRAESKGRSGGWAGWRTFKVVDKIQENDHVASFYLKPQDEGPLPDFKPGQFLSFRLGLPSGQRLYRNYSLSDRPGRDYFRVTVKREPAQGTYAAGLSSNHLHDNVKVGDLVEVGPPLGDFFLQAPPTPDRPLVLLSAGIGLTPLVSMLNTIVEQNPQPDAAAKGKHDIYFVHSTKNSQHHALKAFLRGVAQQHPRLSQHVVYTSPLPTDQKGTDYDTSERVSVELLKKILPSNQAEFYFCGPLSFQNSLRSQLREWGVPDASIHFEFFGPAA